LLAGKKQISFSGDTGGESSVAIFLSPTKQ